ncbi:hypothetical protein AB5I41_27470 [Sphingomonas sp. MMS24-JH45]
MRSLARRHDGFPSWTPAFAGEAFHFGWIALQAPSLLMATIREAAVAFAGGAG